MDLKFILYPFYYNDHVVKDSPYGEANGHFYNKYLLKIIFIILDKIIENINDFHSSSVKNGSVIWKNRKKSSLINFFDESMLRKRYHYKH